VRFLAPVFRGMAKPPAGRRPVPLSNGRMPGAERTGDASSNPAHRRHYHCRSARTRCTDVFGFLLYFPKTPLWTFATAVGTRRAWIGPFL